MHIRPLLLPLICLPLLAAAPAAAPASAPAVQLQKEPTTDAKSSITLHLPQSWVPKKGIDDTGFEAPAKDRVQAGGLAPSVVLAKNIAAGLKPSDIQAALAAKRKQYTQAFPGFKEEKSDNTLPSLPGKGIGRIDGSFLVSNVLPVRIIQIWVIEKDTVYTITLTSLADTFPSNLPTFNAIIKSISVP